MKYPGGKNQEGVTQWIINQMPPHDLYIEAFAGSAAVARMKRPADKTIVIDCDASVANDLSSVFSAMQACTVVYGDAISYLQKKRWARTTLIYCDPPYLMSVRRSQREIYRHEFYRIDQHRKLLDVLLGLDCMVMISGYRSSLYDAMLPAWRREERQVTLRGGVKAVECLWMNYSTPMALHDYQYLGDNFRERERLKRIRNRWKERLLRMPELERRALSSMLAEFDDASW